MMTTTMVDEQVSQVKKSLTPLLLTRLIPSPFLPNKKERRYTYIGDSSFDIAVVVF